MPPEDTVESRYFLQMTEKLPLPEGRVLLITKQTDAQLPQRHFDHQIQSSGTGRY